MVQSIVRFYNYPLIWSMRTLSTCREAVATDISQKSRCTMVYGRIVKCQISYLRRNRDASPQPVSQEILSPGDSVAATVFPRKIERQNFLGKNCRG